MLRKALQMSLSGARLVVMPGRTVPAEMKTVKCTMQFAQDAERHVRFLSSPAVIAPYIAATASKDKVGTLQSAPFSGRTFIFAKNGGPLFYIKELQKYQQKQPIRFVRYDC